MSVDAFDRRLSYPTSKLCDECKKVAGKLSGDAQAWVLALAERAWFMQSNHLLEKVLHKGVTYSVVAHVLDGGADKTIFGVDKPFANAIAYANIMFGNYGIDRLKKIEIIREDKVTRYEPFGPDDILGKKKPSKKKENANERH